MATYSYKRSDGLSPRGRRSGTPPIEEDGSPPLKQKRVGGKPRVLVERNGTLSHLYSSTPAGKIQTPTILSKWSPKQFLFEVFLPEGFPESVSEDYIAYQVFDSIQALASSFTGTLATKAILQGVGVGNETATAAAATAQWIWKDGCGMIGRIMFSWFQGSNLDANAKTWRFMADILNDIAMTMEICIPSFPDYFLPLVCSASVLKAIVGTAGGATRAALTQHQARRDNMADVSSKDGSQETALVLVGMILSLFLNPLIGDSQSSTWIFFLFFTFIHLTSNYMAVCNVAIDKLNRQRADIILEHYLSNGRTKVLTPREVARREMILYFQTNTSIELGCSVTTALKYSQMNLDDLVQKLGKPKNSYLKFEDSSTSAPHVYVLLRDDCEARDILRAHFEARLHQSGYKALSANKTEYLHFERLLDGAGWNTDVNLLGGSQIRVSLQKNKQ